MERHDVGGRSRLSIQLYRARWIVGIPLLVLTLAGCLTSYAAGPADRELVTSPTASLSLPTYTASAIATATPGVTLVPNMAVRAFQTLTATPTPTPTLVPATDTPTSVPTVTPTPTQLVEPTATLRPTDTPKPTDTPVPTTDLPTPAPFQAYAWVDNYYPAPGSVVTVFGKLLRNGRPVNGAQMGVTWSYTHGKDYCTAYSGIDGRAACALNIGFPLQNYWVFLDVVFIYEDQLYYAKTGFLTDP